MIFAVALAVRLLHVWQIRSSPFFDVLLGDAHGYDQWAERLAGGDWVGREVFYQAPLYPYFLGSLYAVVGRDLLVVRLFQAVLGSCSCVLLGLVGWRLFSKPVGIIAGMALALYAPAIFFDGLLQKSVLDLFFVVLGLWLISGIVRGSSTDRSWVMLGLAMGGLSLTRENALVFVVVILGWALIRSEAAGTLSTSRRAVQGIRTAAAFLLGLSVVLVPVAARNAAVGGGFYLTTSQFGSNLYIGNNPAADGTYASLRFGRGAPEFERQDATELAEQALGRRLTPAEVSSYWTGRAVSFMRSEPGAWIALLARKTALLFNVSEMLDTESQESYAEWSTPLWLGGRVGHFGVLVPLALFGLVVSWRDRRRLGVVHALMAAYAASVVLFFVFARYRYPLVPFLVLFASAGIAAAPRFWRASSGLKKAWTLAAVVGVLVFVNRPLLSAVEMRAITENNLGTALQEQKRFEQAITHHERAIALKSDYAPAYNNLGAALRAQGRLDEAISRYRRALDLNPDFADANYNLANALLEQGRAEAAVDEFRQTLRLSPNSVHVHNNLGIALAARGDRTGAMTAFRSALAVDEGSVQAHRNLGNMLADMGSYAEAIAHLKRAVQLAPDQPEAIYDLGGVLLQGQDFVGATEAFRAALRIAPNSADVLNNLGIALATQGQVDEAVASWRRALTIKPGFADAQRNLAQALGGSVR